MVNSDDFIKRLEYLLDYYSLTASSFSEKIGVQRSSLSHLLSGRNKPSLDFVMKIMEEFPEVDLYWILNGKGTMLQNGLYGTDQFTHEKEAVEKISKQNIVVETPKSEPIIPEIKIPLQTNVTHPNNIETIVIFYKDGTFKSYHPKPEAP